MMNPERANWCRRRRIDWGLIESGIVVARRGQLHRIIQEDDDVTDNKESGRGNRDRPELFHRVCVRLTSVLFYNKNTHYKNKCKIDQKSSKSFIIFFTFYNLFGKLVVIVFIHISSLVQIWNFSLILSNLNWKFDFVYW